MWMSRYHNEIFAKAWEYLEFLYTSHLTCFILLNWIAHNFFEHGSLHRFESLKFIFSLNMKVYMIVINVNNKELIWNIGKGHENRITMFLIFDFFFMVFCLLYKDFSCIKRKNSKIDHLLGNQTKIFRSHEIHKIYHFTHICMVTVMFQSSLA